MSRGCLGLAGFAALLSLLGGACEDPPRVSLDTGPPPAGAALARPRPPERRAELSPAVEPGDASPSPRRPPAEPPRPPSTAPPASAEDPAGSVWGAFVVDGLVDIAAAGPATATDRGVAMVNRDNQLWLARRGELPAGAEPAESPVSPLPSQAGPYPLAKGPAVWRGAAYWVSRSRLLRESLSRAGERQVPEVLAEDARVGTRVAVPVGPARFVRKAPSLVAYVGLPVAADGALVAKLWYPGAATSVLVSEPPASATSVLLLASARGLSAFYLEARTGMSAVHRRAVKRQGEAYELGEDRVVWVGGGSRPTTELLPLVRGEGPPLGLLALERDMTHFGALMLDLETRQAGAAGGSWRDYENGLEPAPLAGAHVCGRDMLLLAQPRASVPHSEQRMLWIDASERSPAAGAVLARSRAFFDVSIASAAWGALLSYVADRRTWARTLRCARPAQTFGR